ncbi:MAG: PAS domain-containing sensor histidine kinase [Alphaproteobacteria bacterium]|nr:PAS domain-containing sensor histidine kinase [Alphaproteobacteria bacterium]
MQGFTRNEAGEMIPLSATSSAPGEAGEGNLITRLLEEVARRINFSGDAAFYVAGPTGKILFVSAGYPSIAGSPPENGQIASDVFRFISNNGESYFRDEIAKSDSGLRARHVRSYHYPFFDNAKVLLGIVGHYVEAASPPAPVTPAHNASRLQDQLRASSDLFWELDAAGNLSALSERATDMLGTPAALFIGQGLSAMGRFVERSGEDAPPPEGFSKHQPFRNAIFQVRGPAGEKYHLHMSGVPFSAPDSGNFQGFRGVGVNVTERFEAEDRAALAHRELEQAKEALLRRNVQLDIERGRTERALRAKTDFLATMSHELRTPLNAILGFSEAMTMKLFGGLNEQYAGYADDILRSGRHLLSLINAMQDSAQIDGDELALNLKLVDIAEVVEQSITIVQMRAQAKHLDLRKTAVSPGWKVMADPMLLTQIMVNLFSNAVKFTENDGAIGVEVSTGLESGQPVAIITVWDTGVGIPVDLQKRIFDKFVRGENATAYDDIGQGLGLGLHVSKRLAELMQGSIRLQSVPGKGSRFSVELPLAGTP